jgi:hypothetical protein
MAEKSPSSRKGRKPPEGAKRQFLTSMDPDVIRAIKVAAAELDTTASQVLETAAREWLERHKSKKS